MVIVGITGTLGAGKGTIVEYLTKNKGFKHYSVRQFLIDEIKKQGLDVNRDSMTNVANKLRAEHSPSYIIEQLYNQALLDGNNAIIESIRTPGEIEFLKKKGNFHLIAVDANPKIRYERIKVRGTETDKIGFDTFIANEQREFTTADPNKQNLSKCIEMADTVLQNNGSISDLNNEMKRKLSFLNS